MQYIVTGAAGFIGSNLVRAMNAQGITNIIAVDDLTRGDKFRNLVDTDIANYYDKGDFRERLLAGQFKGKIKAVLHQGACSKTTEPDGRYMMDNNYRYSVDLLNFCLNEKIPFLYASSAAVYGDSQRFTETRSDEMPLNVYGYSKFLFDQYVRRIMDGRSKKHRWGADSKTSQIVGFRYFNVYGPGEWHKGSMASVAYHFYNQYRETGAVKLFAGTDGYGNGEQQRDFIHVDDVVAVNLWFLQHPEVSGIFNLGTGSAATFNEVALHTINAIAALAGQEARSLAKLQVEGAIDYIDFPEILKGKYQSHTQADLTRLRAAGCQHPFKPVSAGVAEYIDFLNGQA